MAQNIYDDAGFFAAYSGLPRSREGLDGAPEWNVLASMLPPLGGLRVLDLGCGFGWFTRWARLQGAASVLGIDVSTNMLARARAMGADRALIYERADLDTFVPPADSFELAFSSLAFHYIADIDRLFRVIHDALRPGGALVFSTEHPVMTAPTTPGWRVDETGRRSWPIERYGDEGERVTDWLAPGVVKQHRTMATTLNALIGAGFAIRRVEEFCPSAEQIAAAPALEEERERPMFLLVAARR